MNGRHITRCLICTFALLGSALAASAQEMPSDYAQVLSTLGRQGDFKDKVLKVNIPRNDLKVTVAGIARPRRSVLAVGWR